MEEVMLSSLKRLVIVATAILAMGIPSLANATTLVGTEGGSTAGHTRPIVSVPPATAPSPEGFQWSDAGIGALGMIALAGVGSGAGVLIRRGTGRPHPR
jgi:hypothetical protein